MEQEQENHYYKRFADKLEKITGNNIYQSIESFHPKPYTGDLSSYKLLGGDFQHCLCGKEIVWPSCWLLLNGNGYIIVGSTCILHFYNKEHQLIKETLESVKNAKRLANGDMPVSICCYCKEGKMTSNIYIHKGINHHVHKKCQVKFCRDLQEDLDSFTATFFHCSGPVREAKSFMKINKNKQEWPLKLKEKMDWCVSKLEELNTELLQNEMINDNSRKFIIDMKGKGPNQWSPKQLKWMLNIFSRLKE